MIRRKTKSCIIISGGWTLLPRIGFHPFLACCECLRKRSAQDFNTYRSQIDGYKTELSKLRTETCASSQQLADSLRRHSSETAELWKALSLATADRDTTGSDLRDFCAKVLAIKDESDRVHLAAVRPLEGLLVDERQRRKKRSWHSLSSNMRLPRKRKRRSPESEEREISYTSCWKTTYVWG